MDSKDERAHVVCCNDQIVCVVIGSRRKAEGIKRSHRHKDFWRIKHRFNRSITEYKQQLFWHIHTVKKLQE